MSITSIIILSILAFCLLGSIFYHPIMGVVGYIITYILSPASQWWGVGLTHQYGIRYSLLLAIAIALGMFLQNNKLNFKLDLHFQEILFLLLIAWIWISRYTGLPPGYFPENFALKLFKVAVFLWMLVRTVNSREKYEIVLWTIILTTTYLGYESFFASTAYYGRLDTGVGGSDFSEGNFLAAHFAMVLPFLGYFFIYGDKKQKLLCIACAVLIVNGFILCRSRGAFLALGVGVLSAVFFTPKGWRTKIIVLLIIGLIGSLQLVDTDFIKRMQRIKFDVGDIEAQDDSASGRILAWRAAIAMAKDHPLGIGQNNFTLYVGDYQPAIPGKDTHSTYLRALAELGIPGFALILAMMLNAFRILKKQNKRIETLAMKKELTFHVFALTVALVIFLTAGLFITETYIEGFYWLLLMPLLLVRVVDHRIFEETGETVEHSKKASVTLEYA